MQMEMPRQTINDDDDDSGSAGAGAEEERSSAAAISTPAPAAASSAGAITTSSPSTTTAPAGVENHPATDDAPVPLAQALAAYDEVGRGNQRGVEVIESLGDEVDVPMPAAMMDTAYDEAEKGSGKGVVLVDDDDEGPAPPEHTVDDGSDSKIAAKKLKAERVRDASHEVRPRAGTHPAGIRGDSVHEPVFEEDDDAEHLHTSSVPRGGGVSLHPTEPSVPILQARLVEDEPERPVCEAQLIEDESERPVYDAIPLESEHWAKRHQKAITGGFLLVITAMAVALGVSFGGGSEGDEGAASRTVIFATSPPTSSTSPTSQPSIYKHPCFVDRRELKAAVDSYIEGGDTCKWGGSECAVVQRYGWPVASWCTSNVTDMSELFRDKDTFNDDLSSWDTSSVTTMERMFSLATLFNQDLPWDTSSVTSMTGMFLEATSFNRDVSNFDTSNVTSMRLMFCGASSFNGDVSNFDTSNVTSMAGMFSYASSFNGDVSSFDTSSATSVRRMFASASSFNGDLSNFDTSSVTTMEGMFSYASSFNGDVSNFDTSVVTSMQDMFADASAFNQDVSSWDVASVTSMRWMFSGATSFNQDLCPWGAHYNATGVYYGDMFLGTNCTNQGDPQGPDANWCAACSEGVCRNVQQY